MTPGPTAFTHASPLGRGASGSSAMRQGSRPVRASHGRPGLFSLWPMDVLAPEPAVNTLAGFVFV